jgi:hypothetical protein
MGYITNNMNMIFALSRHGIRNCPSFAGNVGCKILYPLEIGVPYFQINHGKPKCWLANSLSKYFSKTCHQRLPALTFPIGDVEMREATSRL